MARTAAAVLLLALCFPPHLSPAPQEDWRTDVRDALAAGDLETAREILTPRLEDEDGDIRKTALALVAFAAHQGGDAETELRLVHRYFETFKDTDPDFVFLDEPTRRRFVTFFGRWKTSYPLIEEIFLLEPVETPPPAPPASVRVGLELLNAAYYKVTADGVILEGGMWQEGFHAFSLPAEDLFERPGSRHYELHLMIDDLVVRKPLSVAVEVVQTREPPTATLPLTGIEPRYRPLEGEINIYVGDRLILSSQKRSIAVAAIEFPKMGPSAPNQKPYMPPPRPGEPFSGGVPGVSITDAIGLAIQAVRDLFAKKPPTPYKPSYRRVMSMSLLYSLRDGAGRARDIEAIVRFEPGPAAIGTNRPR